jgi:probable HAF family extracellular repeat protein
MRFESHYVVHCVRLSLIGALFSGVAMAQTNPYTVIEISLGGLNSDVTAVDSHGRAIGSGETTTGEWHPFLYDPSVGIRDLGTLGVGLSAQATALNSAQQIVGYGPNLSGNNRAILWDAQGLHDLGTLGGCCAYAVGITDSGTVVGASTTASGEWHPFVFASGTMHDLEPIAGTGYGTVLGVTLNGLVIGSTQSFGSFLYDLTADSVAPLPIGVQAWTSNGMFAGSTCTIGDPSCRAAIYDSTGVHDLGAGFFSIASSVNSSGHATGWFYVPDPIYQSAQHAFLYDGALQDVGTLGGATSEGHFISDSDVVVGLSDLAQPNERGVGQHAFIYTNGMLRDLNSLVIQFPWDLWDANKINAQGDVFGKYLRAGGGSAVRLTTMSDESNTPIGSMVTMDLGSASVAFSAIETSGLTTVSRIDPTSIAASSGGFSISSLTAFDVKTNATFAGPITIGFRIPDLVSEDEFATLRVLHVVNGQLVDETADTPNRDYATRTVYAMVTSLSPFFIAQSTAKTRVLFDQSKAYKVGSTVPVKIQLLDASGQNVSSAERIVHAIGLKNVGTAGDVPVADSGNANPDQDFRFDATIGGTGGYIFNLKTTGLPSGSYVLAANIGTSSSFFTPIQFRIK